VCAAELLSVSDALAALGLSPLPLPLPRPLSVLLPTQESMAAAGAIPAPSALGVGLPVMAPHSWLQDQAVAAVALQRITLAQQQQQQQQQRAVLHQCTALEAQLVQLRPASAAAANGLRAVPLSPLPGVTRTPSSGSIAGWPASTAGSPSYAAAATASGLLEPHGIDPFSAFPASAALASMVPAAWR
jgi:hypothetical protein